jgi:hypothetical protein
MKAASGIVGLLLAAGVALGGDTVTSVNVVGYVKVSIPPAGKLVFVGLNFESMGTGGDGSMTATELFGTNQLATHTVRTRADRVHKWVPSMGGNGGYLSIYQKPADRKFYLADGSNVQTNPVFRSGDAFWIQSPSLAIATNTITLMGNVPLDTSTAIGHPQGLMMFCNPYPTDLNINGTNINWIANGATAHNVRTRADRIFIWKQGDYGSYWLKPDGKWWNIDTGLLEPVVTVRVGQGAWYSAKGTFTNRWTRPFSLE